MTSYPDTCAKATASFSVLSETIKRIQSILTENKKRDELAKLLKDLQAHEKEKLHLTAACHLERIRECNHNGASSEDAAADPQIGRLLKEGVQSLQQKIGACIEDVNEALEEVRCAMLEEDEMEE
jgi:hypothetical protein